MMRDGATVRSVARTLSRVPSTISRELKKNCPDGQKYEAAAAGERARERRYQRRRWPKLGPHTVLFGVVEYFLRDRWSPEQIAGTLRNRYPDEPEKRVSHETIYNALYVMPKGELRTELLGCLRQARRIRRPRATGEDRRGQIQDMVSLHVRPPKVEDRVIPGHWRGISSKGRSAVRRLEPGSEDRMRTPTGFSVSIFRKGTDLTGFTQDDLNPIAWQMNNRPRKIHGFRTPLQLYNEMLQLTQMPTQGCH